nr:MAG TPA: hypothetical protein [Caudoviricetes sp.]
MAIEQELGVKLGLHHLANVDVVIAIDGFQ